MWIRMKTNARGPDLRYDAGAEVDAPLRIAAAMVSGGFAVPLEVPEVKADLPVPEPPAENVPEPPAVETAAAPPAEEKAIRPAAKPRQAAAKKRR